MRRYIGLVAVYLCQSAALAQDVRSVSSPDGQIEFRLFLAQPEPGALFQLAYQVFFHGKRLLDTSFLGFEIHNQEPILGANLGLTASRSSEDSHYRSLTAEYMQNGSLGRRLTIEARAYNDGIAFRYLVPKSLPLDEILIDDEATEFSFVEDIQPKASLDPPLLTEQRGVAWVAITELPAEAYPRMSLVASEPKTLISHLARLPSDPALAFQGVTPLTSSWRILLISSSRPSLAESNLLKSLR